MNIDFNKYFDLKKLSKKQQAVFVGTMSNLVMARLATMVAEHLSEEEIAELENISSRNDEKHLVAWLYDHIPNVDEGINEILAQESAEMKAKITALNNALVGV
jgi:hemerythrin